ncbi:MAG TPA: sigma-70 family RNA polymerase sigma factor [Pyrinomonadaceae bacterium]|nr:sigma-70 family RNA polymerase sigma factor [Pyrinomonadaceae bacterium]
MREKADSGEAEARPETDAGLVARVLGGEEEAFEELFGRHRRRVALIGSRFFRRPEQIEEVVQESFTKAYFALSDFNARPEGSFAAWLARIAFNSCYDELRRQGRRPETALEDVTAEEAASLGRRLREEGGRRDAESAAVSRDLAEKLLNRLSAEDRMVLVMLEVEEMPVAEIAGALGWSLSKVKVRAHRARAALRRALGRFL